MSNRHEDFVTARRTCARVLGVLALAGALGCGGGSIGERLGDAGADPDARERVPDARPGPDAAECPSGSEPLILYRDSDGDGSGDPDQVMSACEPIDGYVTDSSDCDDGDGAVHPGAEEICDFVDNDCAGGDPCAASAVARWRLDDAQGLVAGDDTGHGHDGTLRNNPAWTADGTALSFDGVDDYVEVPHEPGMLLDEGTVVMWFQVADVTVQRGLFSKDSSGYDTGGHLSIYTTAAVDTELATVEARLQSIEVSNYATSAATIAPNTWHHLAFAFGPDGMRLRVDTELVSTNAYAGGLGPSSGGSGNIEPIVIGVLNQVSDDQATTPISSPLYGKIRDVQLYNRALSAAEIADLYDLTQP